MRRWFDSDFGSWFDFNNASPRRFSFDVWRLLLFRYFGFPIHRRGSLSEVRIFRLSACAINFRLLGLSLPNVKGQTRPAQNTEMYRIEKR